MKNYTIGGCLLGTALLVLNTGYAETAPAGKTEHGEYRDWRLLGVSLRHEKNSMRAIVGNDAAIQAARADKVNPWPDGAVIGKIKWGERKHPKWEQASVPAEFTAAEAMVKDGKKYAKTGGWGFGIWEGKVLKMLDQEKSAECFACHTLAKDSDYVFTLPNF